MRVILKAVRFTVSATTSKLSPLQPFRAWATTPGPDTPTFITHSGSDPEVLEAMKALAAELQPFKEIHITHASATICAHCGPNTTGILFITK